MNIKCSGRISNGKFYGYIRVYEERRCLWVKQSSVARIDLADALIDAQQMRLELLEETGIAV